MTTFWDVHHPVWTSVIVSHESQLQSSSSPPTVGVSSQSLSHTQTPFCICWSLWESDIHSAPASSCNMDNSWLYMTHICLEKPLKFFFSGVLSTPWVYLKKRHKYLLLQHPPKFFWGLVITAEPQLAWSREECSPFSDTPQWRPFSLCLCLFSARPNLKLQEVERLALTHQISFLP